MSHPTPEEIVEIIARSGGKKDKLDAQALMIKGMLSGALLAFATAFAYTIFEGMTGGGARLISGLVFPVGFAMIVLLGLELATGNFAIMTVGLLRGTTSTPKVFRNWLWVYFANFLGSIFVGALLVISMTHFFAHEAGALGVKIVEVAHAKTLAYEELGARGWITALVKGILCNWLVCLGAVLGIAASTTSAKIVALWLPIATFFTLALEHSVVNMFVIPTAMMLGADISIGQWLVWNQIPVTIGNLIGGGVLTAMALHFANTPDPA